MTPDISLINAHRCGATNETRAYGTPVIMQCELSEGHKGYHYARYVFAHDEKRAIPCLPDGIDSCWDEMDVNAPYFETRGTQRIFRSLYAALGLMR